MAQQSESTSHSKKFSREFPEEKSTSYPSTKNPTEVTDYHCIVSLPPTQQSATVLRTDAFGKWKVSRLFSQLDQTWHMIREATETGVLASCTLGARCTTMFYNPTHRGVGPCTSGVISVFTTEENVDKAGMALINLVKHDIKYKRQNPRGALYRSLSLYWNQGEPSSFSDHETPCCGPLDESNDVWQLNCVASRKPFSSAENEYGHWIIETEPDNWDLTGLWHELKRKIENDELSSPVKMVSPAKRENEAPVFIVHTSCENKEEVGRKLACIVQKSIYYVLNNMPDRQSPVYEHQILWKDNNPVYVMKLN